MDVRLSRRRTPSRTRRELFPALVLLTLLAPAATLAQGSGPDTLVLRWTATGDDGLIGTAAQYEVRMSSAAITESNWSSAAAVNGAPAPLPSGTRQSMVVRGVSRGSTYYFAVKVVDDAGNVSAISNVVRWDGILDSAPPSAPAGLTAAIEPAGEVRVRWSPNSEPDLAGYTVYRSLSAGGPFQPLNGPPTTATEYIDRSIPSGATGAWYQVSATDQTGNESARSAAVAVDLAAATTTAWRLGPVYPNPSKVSAPLTIQVDVPTAGAAGAEIHVVDASGRLVRRLALGGLGGGLQTVTWNGRNEAGSATAPGVYTAWLVGGDSRRSFKLVRVP